MPAAVLPEMSLSLRTTHKVLAGYQQGPPAFSSWNLCCSPVPFAVVGDGQVGEEIAVIMAVVAAEAGVGGYVWWLEEMLKYVITKVEGRGMNVARMTAWD